MKNLLGLLAVSATGIALIISLVILYQFYKQYINIVSINKTQKKIFLQKLFSTFYIIKFILGFLAMLIILVIMNYVVPSKYDQNQYYKSTLLWINYSFLIIAVIGTFKMIQMMKNVKEGEGKILDPVIKKKMDEDPDPDLEDMEDLEEDLN